jgi:hypothetical protein
MVMSIPYPVFGIQAALPSGANRRARPHVYLASVDATDDPPVKLPQTNGGKTA